MLYTGYIWLLLCYAQNARSNLMDDYEDLSRSIPPTDFRKAVELPEELGTDRESGCRCRATSDRNTIVCFGNYECTKFPKVSIKSNILRVRTTFISKISRKELDALFYLKELDIEANQQLKNIEAGTFKNLSSLQHLSISYNTQLHTIDNNIFEGLINLKNLTLVNNGFTNILHLTPAFRPSILPMLTWLDLSENPLETISENAFVPMEGTLLKKLDVCLSRIETIHENSFLPLKNLKELQIAENDLSSNEIAKFLVKMSDKGINLTYLDLSGMGFRKQPPRHLMNVIAKTSIKWLGLGQNQFEIIADDTFPLMANIELLDLRKVLAISVSPNAFAPYKFPNLKYLLLSGNLLPGAHQRHIASQLIYLDLSNNKGNPENPTYFEIYKNIFLQYSKLKVLNLGFNTIKAIFNYTFQGLNNLKILNIENGTIYHIGKGTFKPLKNLKVLNLGNNPLSATENITSAQFEGLNELNVFILQNCGIKQFNDDDNIFEMMPNLTHLILKNNQLHYILPETLKPLKFLKMLDLSQNLLIAWWKPLFLSAGVKPLQIYLTNNKISQFTIGMIQDINYLLEGRRNQTTEIDLMDNVITCDCATMYKTSVWLEANGSAVLNEYFRNSDVRCSGPDIWEYRRVADYLASIKRMKCFIYDKINHFMVLIWTAPSVISVVLVILVCTFLYKYRMYIRYWLFLAKLALGRKFIRSSLRANNCERKVYKYDAFISYCNEDRMFVSEIISQLETIPPYFKLCIYERDFELGSFISEAVLTSINDSKFVILLISNNFAKSQWCRWETQLAEYHRLFLADGTAYDPLVLIKIGDIENKYLTTTLKYLLKTKIYHSWDEHDQDEFWRKLRNVLSREV